MPKIHQAKAVAKVLDVDGQFREAPDFPIAVVRETEDNTGLTGGMVLDPILEWQVMSNLTGRILTLVEATTEAHKLKAVKDLFRKELTSWQSDVYQSARELAMGGDSSTNLYSRNLAAINRDTNLQ